MPADLRRYGPGWAEFSSTIRFERAGGRCECSGECGLHLTHPGPRRCEERHGEPARWAKGKVVLTMAHRNYSGGPCQCDPPCMIQEHVAACCQRCHLRWDAQLHMRNAAATRERKRSVGQARLFDAVSSNRGNPRPLACVSARG